MVELTDLQYVDLKEGQLVQTFESVSSVRISSSASSGPEPADAYFAVFDQGQDQLQLFIGFLFLESQSRILYRSQVFSSEESAEVMVQAESFVGEMGFMMDDQHYGQASEQEKQEIRDQIPIFYEFLEDYQGRLSGAQKEKGPVGPESDKSLGFSSEQSSSLEEAALKLLSMI